MDLGSFRIYRKEGWKINPDDKVVNGIIRGIFRCNGHCPCANKYSGDTGGKDVCPCYAYREEDYCCCGLYVKEK
jgi:ferredoxin-thioredoxin reductase catalytic subunit